MTTAPNTLVALQSRLVSKLHTVNLGIVGDDRHVLTGGYHIGARSLRNAGMGGDYSLEFKLDNQVNHDYACGIDVGGSPDLLNVLGTRLVRALKAYDPRVYGKVRGTNARWDHFGSNRRYDTESPTTKADDNAQPTSDQGHMHIEIYRSLVTEMSVINDLFEVLSTPWSPNHQSEGSGHPLPAGKKVWQGQPVPKLIANDPSQYFGLISGGAKSHGGYYSSERGPVKMLQQRLIACGYVPGQIRPSSGWADGIFGSPTRDAVVRFQLDKMKGVQHIAGRVYHRDWTKLFNL